MKRRLHLIISALFILLAVLTLGTGFETGILLRGKAVTYESSKPEAAKKKKKKKNKTKTETKTETKSETKTDASQTADDQTSVEEDGTYTSKEEVAAYIHAYGHLPSNYITKKEAKALGWVSSEGNLDEVAPGKSIGGDYFGNYEGKLPEKSGRSYYECDIDFTGDYRGAKRIIYSNDGLVYYTEDHYNNFEQLY